MKSLTEFTAVSDWDMTRLAITTIIIAATTKDIRYQIGFTVYS